MDGTLSQKTGLRNFQTDSSLPWWEVLLLFGSGGLAVILHRATDSSLGLPGHHGIEWMALMIIGRASSRFRGAGSITSLGAAFGSTLPLLAGDNPYTWLFYLLPGPMMDLAFRYLPTYASRNWFLVLLGGIAHATKPVTQLVINLATGFPFGSFRYGVMYPFTTHLLFGMIGGFVGVLIVLGIRRVSSKSS